MKLTFFKQKKDFFLKKYEQDPIQKDLYHSPHNPYEKFIHLDFEKGQFHLLTNRFDRFG